MVANPGQRSNADRIPDFRERKEYMARLHATLMHGEPWYGLLKPPPPRKPKIYLGNLQEQVLDYLIEFGPSTPAAISGAIGCYGKELQRVLQSVERMELVTWQAFPHNPKVVYWSITDAGRAAAVTPTPAAIDHSTYHDVRLMELPKRPPERDQTPAHVAKPEEYIHTPARMLTEDEAARESSPCLVYRPNPKTGSPELVKIIPSVMPVPSVSEKPKPPPRGSRYPNILDDPRCAEAVRLYRDEGLRYNDVARSLHIRNQRLKEMLTASGVTIRTKGGKS